MNEILLILFFILFLLLPRFFLNKMKQPYKKYIRTGCGLLLLLLVWLDQSNSQLWPKILISVVVIYSMYRAIFEMDMAAGKKDNN